MTQHLDHPVTPMIDAGVDAVTTTPATGTPQAQNPGWPPPGAPFAPAAAPYGAYGAPAGTFPGAVAPEAPLNTLSWVSVASAFIVSPAAIVLGIVSRRQIARTGERGKALATVGIALGLLFTLIGTVTTVLVLSMATTVTVTSGSAPAPAPVAAAPVAAAPSTPDAATAGPTTGQADLLAAYLDLIGAAQQLNQSFGTHSSLDEFRADVATYRDAVQKFRDVATTVNLPADEKARVDGQLVPAIDKVLADCDAMAKAGSQSKLESAAGAFDTDNPAMVETAAAVIDG